MTAGAADGPSWADTVADLRAGADSLSRRLGVPVVATPGASGLLNPHTRASVWVHDPVVWPDLLGELTGTPVPPELLVAPHVAADPAALDAAGYRPTGTLTRVHRPLHAGDVVARAGRAAVAADLPALRRLQERCFGGADGALYLPAVLLDLPGVHLRLLDAPDGGPAGLVGVRLRQRDALVFGLATCPDRRGRGHGGALLRAALSWAAEQGAGAAVADVDAPPGALWRRAGFRPGTTWTRFSPAA